MKGVADFTADQAAGRVLETLPPAMRAIRQQMRSGNAETGLSVAQFRTLVFLRRNAGSSLSPLAEHLGSSLPSASQLVDRLVRAGLVTRATSQVARRCIDLRLTEAGRVALEERESRTRAWLGSRLDTLAPERLAALVAALDDLCELVSVAADPPP